jgi:4-oxalocrotonate tautomerase
MPLSECYAMPIITVSMYPGRTQQQKEEFAKAITKSAVEILKTKESHVIVVFEDNPKENWYMASKPL